MLQGQTWSGNYTLPQLDEQLLKQLLATTFDDENPPPEANSDVAKSRTHIRVIICLTYAVIFLLGILGNALVVFVIMRKPEMRSVTNLFITNLAISDILMTIFATPFTPLTIFLEDWPLHWTLCKLLPMTMAVTVYVSTLTSTAIAIDRYLVIVHPFLPKMRTWMCFLIIVLTWVLSAVCSCPLAVYQDKKFSSETNTSSCQENWPSVGSRATFTMASFGLQFIVPCIIITACYTRIGFILRRRAQRKIGTKTREKEEADLRRKRRANKMLIAMVVIFVVCWIPLNCLWMVTDLGMELESIQNFAMSGYFTLVFFIVHILAMSSAVYNPFLYTWLNDSFRHEFHQILPCLGLIDPQRQVFSPSTTAMARKSDQMEGNCLITLSEA